MTVAGLRPLGFGELMDRAVTLCVRNAGLLLTVITIPNVLFALIEYGAVGDVLMRSAAQLTSSQWRALLWDVAIALVVFAFERTAAVVVANARYTGEPVTAAGAFRRALARTAGQVLNIVIALLAAAAILVALAIPFVVVATLATAGGGRGTVPILIALLVLGLAALVLLLWLALAYQLASVRIALRTANPLTALFASLRATAFRAPWRSLLAGLVATLLGTVLVVIFSAIADLMPSPGLRLFVDFGLMTVGSIAGEALTVAFVVAYDVDIAVRYEGLDLTMALAR
jgi:hypothetical protein